MAFDWSMLGGSQGQQQAPAAQPNAPAPQAPQQPGLMQQWNDFLSKPENKAGMIQAGIALLQPIMPGQSLGGRVGYAIGQGMGAHDRNLQGRANTAEKAREAALDERKTAAYEQQTKSMASRRNGSGLTPAQIMAGNRADANSFQTFWTRMYNLKMKAAQDPLNQGGETPEQIDAYYRSPEGMAEVRDQWQEFRSSLGMGAPGGSPAATSGAETLGESTAVPAASPGAPAAQAPPPDNAPEGSTATNRATGQRMQKRGGQWVPIT